MQKPLQEKGPCFKPLLNWTGSLLAQERNSRNQPEYNPLGVCPIIALVYAKVECTLGYYTRLGGESECLLCAELRW